MLSKAIRITLGRVANTIINCLSPIKTLKVIEWLDDNAVADAVNAPVIGKLIAKGAKANAKKGIAFSAGHFQAGVQLPVPAAAPVLLKSAKIAGDLGGAWVVAGDVGTISAGRLLGDLHIAGNAKRLRFAGPFGLIQPLAGPVGRLKVEGAATVAVGKRKLRVADATLFTGASGYDLEDDLRYFNQPGAWWDYDVTVKGGGWSITDTVRVSVDSVNSPLPDRTDYDVSAVSGSNAMVHLYTSWFTDGAGVHMKSWRQELEAGQHIEIGLTDSPLVAPDNMTDGAAHSAGSAFAGTWTIDDGAEYISGDCSGEATITGEVLALEAVTVPLGVFTAVKGELLFSATGTVDFSYEGQHFTGTLTIGEQQTFWAVPGVGVVKAVTRASIAMKVPGAGNWSYSYIATQVLRDTSMDD
ncbi:hypothetical protein LCGC14_2485320 [marine sediment metagenome]|uniref:Uncharacterized protein n=1 Tax=marine sediment metagenome TaxID=412755 RepID=A0A0F9E013_9ZZZZ